MATDIVIPQLGESISEAVIASWLKGDGEYVERDEEIVELETDKVTMPLPSSAAGILRHNAAEGDTVAVGAVVARVDESADKPKSDSAGKSAKKDEGAAKAKQGKKESDASASPPAATTTAEAKPAKQESTSPPASSKEAGASKSEGDSASKDVNATPVARKLAEEQHLDLSRISGTGPGGRIREQDVLAYLQTAKSNGSPAQGTTPSAPAPSGAGAFSRETRRERMSQLRQRIAVRLVEAQHTAAMLTTFNECDMSRVMALRSKHKDDFEKSHGVRLGFMSFFIKAACSALKKYPSVNAYIVSGEKGPEVEYHDYCDIAVAVGTDKGLVVPVLRNAESLSFAGIESGIGDLAVKARDGKLTIEDMSGGTFTISNGGVYGSMMSTPILNPPQSGILGMHNIIRRPIENPDKPGSGEVVVRPMMYLALSYDHRIVDGEGAVRFLRHIKECIEDPERLLLGM
ncbi:MAG: 2-oxoglutarate dehydrogenase complex dihydrolipoyllysine-residue succinyltransferase [Phycisphaeraceae bacterium]|nr:MAG: 2-oxoglutarate dehydrogenase complex dihydrolipoyllysine-residue succinyltransferase [Phycisphaeraceae bacterium]